MSPAWPLARLIRLWVAALLVLIFGTLIYGHLEGASRNLSLLHSYVTEYGNAAPHWPWIVVASFSFAVVLMLLAWGSLLQSGRSPLGVLGGMMLAGAAMAMFFVSYAPVREVEQPPPSAHHWWTPHWWFTSQTARTPEEHGMARAYSDVHYHAIKLALVNGLLGMIMIALSRWNDDAWRQWSRFTMIAAFVMAGLFVAGDRLLHLHGLWQRLGFGLMYVWLWSARGRLIATESPAPRAEQGPV